MNEKLQRALAGLIRTLDYLCIMIGLPVILHLWSALFK